MNNKLPKIYIGGDHASYLEREKLQKHLYELGYDVYSVGSDNTITANYAIYALKVANRVQENPGSLGIVICGSGIGVNIAANKVRGVKSALVYTEMFAKLARNKNYNVIALGSRFIPYKKIQKIVETYLNADTTVKDEVMQLEYYDIDLSNKIDGDDFVVNLNPLPSSENVSDETNNNSINRKNIETETKDDLINDDIIQEIDSVQNKSNQQVKVIPKKQGRPKKVQAITTTEGSVEAKPKRTRKPKAKKVEE